MGNLRGALMMVVAMASFAVEDTVIKQLAQTLPVGQILSITCGGALALFLLWFRITDTPFWQSEYRDLKVNLRTTADVIGSCFFVTSLSLIPLTTASAVIQATPLVVATGAALFLGQSVGWRRWFAILVGFVGVIVIIRPGMAGFSSATLLAVAGMMGLAARDLLTRSLTVSLSGPQLASHTFAAIIPAGIFLVILNGEGFVWPNATEALLLFVTVVIGMGAYLAIVAATRDGNAGIISSFRYSRMIFALIIGFIVFAEVPDTPTIVGATIVIVSGLFTLLREARLRSASIRLEPEI